MISPTDRLRVAYFVPPSPHFAGVELVVHEIATGLMEAYSDELDVHVIYSTPYADARLVQTQYQLHTLGVDRLRRLPASLRKRVADLRPDILISAQVEPSVLAWTATRGLGLPYFVTHLHGNPQIEEVRGSRRTRLAFGVFKRIVAPRTAAVLAVSPTLRDYAARSLSQTTPVLFAKNPARELGGSTERTPRIGGRFHFVNVARLDHQKGLDVLLHAVAEARQQLPPFTVTLVGSGPDETDLRTLSRDLGVDDLVQFAGYTTDPGSFLRRADCFVLSSRWEGFPLVLLEALSLGLPLLAADCNFGPSDLITDPRIGDLVTAADPHALADGLVRAAGRPADPDAEDFRRQTAGQYRRPMAAAHHYAVLKQIINPPGRAGRASVRASQSVPE